MATPNSPPNGLTYNPLGPKRLLSRAVLGAFGGAIVTAVVQGLAFPELADSGLFGPRDEGSYYIELAILFGAFIPVNIIILSAVLCLYYPLMAASRRERHETFESPHIHAVACALFAGAIVALSAGGDPLSVAAFAVPLALCTWVAAILMGFFIRDGLRLTYALLGHDTVKSAG